MFKFKNFSYKKYMWLGCCVSVYILAAYIFPCFRFKVYILPEETIEAFNSLTKDLSVGYLTGVLVYFLTESLLNKINRKKRIWEIYDKILLIENAKNKMLEDIGVNREEFLKLEDYINVYGKDVFNNFEKVLARLLKDLAPYDNLLTEKERNLITSIYRNKAIEGPWEEMDDIYCETNFRKLKQVCADITTLSNNIIKEVNSEGQKRRKS